jgi:hypothetical protein
MVRTLSFQGISDYVAYEFMEEHGSVTWPDIGASLRQTPTCHKLCNYWTFGQCGYSKAHRNCNRPDLIRRCPLPVHPLRNGRLNQLAYSLYFFIRDIAGGDFVNWLAWTIDAHCADGKRPDLAREALIVSMRSIYGVSDKTLTMLLSDLLIAGGNARPGWLEVGTGMIVVDTLVHNFLWRTGILCRHGAEHGFGPLCYAENGCANLIRAIARKIDARRLNATFPANFPRFVQHAIWHYCAQQGLDICNGNRIKDDHRCQNVWCPIYESCDKRVLRLPTR